MRWSPGKRIAFVVAFDVLMVVGAFLVSLSIPAMERVRAWSFFFGSAILVALITYLLIRAVRALTAHESKARGNSSTRAGGIVVLVAIASGVIVAGRLTDTVGRIGQMILLGSISGFIPAILAANWNKLRDHDYQDVYTEHEG